LKLNILAVLACAFVACAPASQETSAATTTEAAATASVDSGAAKPATATTTTAAANEEKPMSYYQDKVAELQTSKGTIVIRFYPDKAPNHVKNFVDLAEKGFYNGTKFHRVIPGFMIQGGDPNTKTGAPDTWGFGGSEKKVAAEFNDTHHARGVVSMARSQDPDSASSQFFICVADAGFLDRQYTAFGEVVKGMEIADTIVSSPRGAQDRPNDPTTITAVKIRPAADAEKGAAAK
jgi:cyclophilin family peptidyl-prolyl cis-trans isomerase